MTTETPDLRSGLDAEFREVSEALLRRLRDIDEWISVHQHQLRDLRELRREIVTPLKALIGESKIPEPPVAPGYENRGKPGPKSKPKSNSGSGHKPSEALLASLLESLRANTNGNTFTPTEYAKAHPELGSKSRVMDAIRELAKREQLALDHMGGPRGKTKFYKLVS